MKFEKFNRGAGIKAHIVLSMINDAEFVLTSGEKGMKGAIERSNQLKSGILICRWFVLTLISIVLSL